MTKILTEVEARYEIAKLISGLMTEKGLEMTDVASDLNQAVIKLKKINLRLKSCN